MTKLSLEQYIEAGSRNEEIYLAISPDTANNKWLEIAPTYTAVKQAKKDPNERCIV